MEIFEMLRLFVVVVLQKLEVLLVSDVLIIVLCRVIH
jgi:hypothetical protein